MKNYIKEINYEANRQLWVAVSIKGDQFAARVPLRACRMAKRALRGELNYLAPRAANC
jgi:hypothetical protein